MQEYIIETSEDKGETWREIPGVIFKVTFEDGKRCEYEAGYAEDAANAAKARLEADEYTGLWDYRIRLREF
ncbi:hypothetical protein AB0G00_23740 [Nocardia salmonicida]|uniref:hypothetical protein n=1 Tax=Nocardia salmonicida TaxID=53431 RepID=UPI0033F2016D